MVMEHCLSKVKDLNVDQEPSFVFFNIFFFLYACMCVRVYLLSLEPCGSRDFEIGSRRRQGFFILLRWVRPWIVFNFKII